MRYHTFSTIKEIHIEITNKCNASCPMCARNNSGGAIREGLILGEWSLSDAKLAFGGRFENLRNILFCGTHGDPAVAKDCLPIIAEARATYPEATIEFYSNGSVRTPSWWAELAGILKLKKSDDHYRSCDLGVFSIDGLEDSNSIYRRGTNFSKIIENALAFIQAGGNARWDFLVFKHNEHQVEKAEKLAKKLGFKKFRIRKTSRFALGSDGNYRHPVKSKEGAIEYHIEPPVNLAYVNNELDKYMRVVALEDSGHEKIASGIECLYRNKFGRIYINALLKAYPCCFISSDTFPSRKRVFEQTKAEVTEKYGDDFNDLKKRNWTQILEHSWFAKDLVESWIDPSKSLIRCQRTCGKEVSPILSQSQDRNI